MTRRLVEIHASELTQEHVGRMLDTAPLRGPARVLSVEHGGPFQVPESLRGGVSEYLTRDGYVSDAFSVHLTVEHPEPNAPEDLHVWLLPTTLVEVEVEQDEDRKEYQQ